MEGSLAQSMVRTVFPLLQPTSTPILNVLSPEFRPVFRRHLLHFQKSANLATSQRITPGGAVERLHAAEANCRPMVGVLPYPTTCGHSDCCLKAVLIVSSLLNGLCNIVRVQWNRGDWGGSSSLTKMPSRPTWS